MENWLVEVCRHILQLPDMGHEYIHHWVKFWCGLDFFNWTQCAGPISY